MTNVSNQAVQMLRQLASGVRPVGAAATTAAGAVQPGDFSALLKQAQAGELTSSTPVTVAPDAGVKLSEDQLAQVSLAADKAEAAGIRTAVVLLEGQAVMLDVGDRTITGPAQFGDGRVLTGVDGVINLAPGSAAGAGSASILPLPAGSALQNPSLLDALAGAERSSEAA